MSAVSNYGSNAYGTSGSITVAVGTATETDSAFGIKVLQSVATITASITPTSTFVQSQTVQKLDLGGSSITPTGAVSKKIGAYIANSVNVAKNDIVQYDTGGLNIYNTPGFSNQLPALITSQSGLIKRVSKKFTASLTPTSTLAVRKRNVKTLTGSITPASTLSTAKFTRAYQSMSTNTITPSSSVQCEVVDPSEIQYLIKANAQKVIPRVKAYWANGKFTKNLIGLSSSDIYQEKTLDLNPVVYYKFDELTNVNTTEVLDTSVKNYDGIYVNSKTAVTGPLLGNDAGKKALSLSGTGFVRLYDNDDINPVDNFQIECWVRIPTAPASEQFIYSKGTGSTNASRQYGLSVKTDGSLNAYVYVGSSSYTVASSAITANVWYHVILTVKDHQLSLIINGVQAATTNVGADINVTAGSLEIGRLAAVGSNFTGDIDEFAFYTQPRLSASGGAYARYRSALNDSTSQWYKQFYPEQIMNGFTRVSYVWGVTDTKKLNGELITANGEAYAMEAEQSFRYEHGWWSRSLSNNVGDMPFVETVVCEFDSHPCTQIDVFASEFFAGIRNFDLYYKNTSDVWVKFNTEAPVTMDIDDYLETLTFASVTYIKGIRVDILSVWGSNDVARLEEVDPTYVTDISDDIVSFDISTDREDFDSNIPIGSANANSISLSLSNVGLDYSVYNSSSIYKDFILPDVKFEVELGWSYTDSNGETTTNYMPLGTFWADEWQESSDDMVVNVNARDYSKFLQETTVVGNVVLNTDGAAAVADLLKETNFPVYDIQAELPYDSTCLKNNAVGLWMMNESELNQYALSWNQELVKQTAVGSIEHGPDDSFTLMFWVNTFIHTLVNERAERTIAHFYKNNSNYLHVSYSNTGINVDIGGSKVNTRAKIADGLWHQISITWDHTNGSLKTYQDGQLVSTLTCGVGKTLDGTGYFLSLGAKQSSRGVVEDVSGARSTQFIGLLGHVLLWDKAFPITDLNNFTLHDVAFREPFGLEEHLLLSFTGFNGEQTQLDSSSYLISKAYSQDFLRLVNVSFEQVGFMQHQDHAGFTNMLSYGSIEYAADDGAFALEPYNKAVLLNGKDPDAIFLVGAGSSLPVSSVSSDKVNITGDIDIYIQLSLPTIQLPSEAVLYSKYNTTGNQRSLRLSLRSTGVLRFSYSTNGSSDVNIDSTVPLQNKDIRPNEKFWIRVSHDVDNGASGNNVAFYISKQDLPADEITGWELVSSVTTAGALASGRFANTSDVVIGADAAGGSRLPQSYVYAVYVTSEINSSDTRIDFNSDNFTNTLVGSSLTFTDNERNTWTVRRPGAELRASQPSYLAIPPNSSVNITDQSFTFAMWVKPKANESYILANKDLRSQHTVGSFALFATDDGRISAVRKSGQYFDPLDYVRYGQGCISNAGKLIADEWNFITVVYSYDQDVVANRILKIYVDSSLVASAPVVEFAEVNGPWFIGTDSMTRIFCGEGVYLNGLVLFDKAISETEVKTLYRAGASLVNTRFPAIWSEEGETVWDVMLATATADLGTFYFDYEDKFVYSNALNNYSDAYEEFAETQWYLDDSQDIISASQTIALQTNKVIVRLQSDGIDFNKRESLWSAPDNATISGAELASNLTSSFTGYLDFKPKVILGEGGQPVTIPDFPPAGFVKIDDEIIRYNRKDNNRLYDLERGVFETTEFIDNHAAGSRVREARLFNVEYSSKPAIVLEDPLITAVIYDKTVDIDVWRPSAFGGVLLISRNETGDAYLQQVLASTDPLNNINNALIVSGVVFSNPQSTERDEYESADYSNNIRRYGLKQVEITNRFIFSRYSAKRYADYFLRHFDTPVPMLDVTIMGNPMIKLGDRVTIQTLDRMGLTLQDYWVESNNIQYSGGIEQQLRLRKVN